MSRIHRTVAVTSRCGWPRWLRNAAALLIALAAALPALAGQVALTWDADTDLSVTGYYVYYGTASHNYASKIDAGKTTSGVIPSLAVGQTYFFAVTAYNALKVESPYSNEVSATIPSPPPAQTGIASSTNPAALGASVTFTATVSGTAPTGNVTFTDGGTTIAGCAAVVLSGSGNIRTAICATSSLPTGTHSIVARYNGDAGNGASSSSAISQVISAAVSITTLVSSLNPSTSGANVTFTATVTGSAPTGNVNFKDGATSIAGCSAVALSGSGNSRTAVCTTAALAVGTHSITAAYGGNAGNAASTSTALSQVVNKATSATTLVSSLNPSASGASVTLTATVTGSAPTGSINFKDGATSITGCSAVALTGVGNSRTAACTTASLSVATHSITASYGGDAANNASTSAALSQVVNKATSVTTLSSSANPAMVGASVTLTATVTGSAPTGSVNFKDGASSITGCSAVALTGSGNSLTAACTTSSLAAGTHSITAAYAGDANNTATTSSALSQVVNALATTSTVVSSSLNPSTSGANVTFTATVTGSAPTGTVNFKDGAASIAGCSAVALTGAGNSRTATCSTASLSVATHSITASYGGNAANNPSTSTALSQVVQAATTPTTTTLASSLNPSTSGANVTFTATVTGSAPTGTVNFKDGAASIAGCSAVALTGAGNSRTATCSTASLSVATHSITASYGGNAANNPSTSTALSQVVQAATTPTTTTLASSLNPSTSGANVTFTATVTGSAPTGTVNFKDGAASIAGCSAVALTGAGNSRTATCSTASLSVATHSITASYGGDAGNNASTSGALSQVVNSGGAQINVALASNGGVASASSTLIPTMFPVSAVNNGDRAGLGFAAGGVWVDGTAGAFPDWVQINFSGSKTIDHVIVYSMQDNNSSPVDPSATMTFSLYGLTAFTVQSWNGAAWVTLGSVSGNNLVKRTVNFAPTTTDRIRVNVTNALAGYSRIAEVEAWTSAGGGGGAATTTTLASSLNPSTSGATVTFTATVTGTAPTGTVNFMDGAASIAGCSAVALTGAGNSRTATCSTASLSVATHSITASYGGDAANNASTSAALSQVVQAATAPTTTTLASSLNPSTSGANVTFTATVTGSAPTGTVNFKDGAASIAGCSAVALTGAGNSRTATCSTASLSVATHSITASYGGDAGNNASTSGALSQVVNSGGAQINVALASNGGVASASSTLIPTMFPVSAVNNGDRAGLGFAAGGVWIDGTSNTFPDWVQINFSGSKTIDHVIVYSMQDNNSSPVDPPATMTFSLYGLTDFQVQGWNGSAWVTLGTVTGNNLVKRTVNFAPTATDRIRVNITHALAGYSRVAEIEAWGN